MDHPPVDPEPEGRTPSADRTRSWMLRALVSFGLGLVVLIGWSAAASASASDVTPDVGAGLPTGSTSEVTGTGQSTVGSAAGSVVTVPNAPVAEPTVTHPPVAEVVERASGAAPSAAPPVQAPADAPVEIPAGVEDIDLPSQPSVPPVPTVELPDPGTLPGTHPIVDQVDQLGHLVHGLPVGSDVAAAADSVAFEAPRGPIVAIDRVLVRRSNTDLRATDLLGTQPSLQAPAPTTQDDPSRSGQVPVATPPVPVCGTTTSLVRSSSGTALYAITGRPGGIFCSRVLTDLFDSRDGYSSVARARPDVAPD